jgi:dihydroorotase
LCDAGSTGSATFAGLRQVIDREVRTRTRAFVNLSAIGIVGTSRGGELSHFPYADPEGCARTISENPDLAIGVKLRYGPGLVWEYSPQPVKLARKTADMAGRVPMMMHITDSPIPLPELLAHMKPGDIVTHCYHGRAHGIMGQEKQLILKEVVEAQRHGIIFDCAHGRNHFSFPMIEKALDQGFLPDTISTDLTFTSATQGPVFDLPTTMSKLLHFGLPLEEVVRRGTGTPAKILGYEGTVGTLKPGANADIAVFELRDGNFPLRDSDGNTVNAKRRFFAQPTITDGRVWYERPGE